jgi:cytoskeleton protein RodZ
MSSERAEEPTTPDNRGGHPGQILAAQREAMGWTVEQVADQLKLAVRQVVALEAGDYASLPSPAVTRGFVRAYAKLVRVDPAPLVAQIAIDTPGQAEVNNAALRRPTPASFSQAKFPSHGKRSALPLSWIAAAVAVVAVGAGAWHFGLMPGSQHAETTAAAPAASAPAAAETHGSATETLQNPSVPLISVPGQSSAPAAAQGAVVNAPATTATGAPPAAGSTAQLSTPPANPVQAQSPAQAAAAPAAAPAAAAASGNALVLNVREDAWIEVKPAKGGTAMIKRLVRAGSTETVNVDQPVRVIVGNPGAVSASLRGAPVALPLVPGKTYALVNLQ